MAEYTKPYGGKFRAKMVQRMSGPVGESATALSRKVGVPQATLSRWLREAGRVGVMNERPNEPPPGVGGSKRPEDWTAEEKLKVVAEAVGLDDAELGVLLRRKGLHEAQLVEWRKALLGSLDKPGRKSPSVSQERKEIRRLERELRRKDKALAETAALLVLQGKARALWGDEGDDT
jgi:transposase-like protein